MALSSLRFCLEGEGVRELDVSSSLGSNDRLTLCAVSPFYPFYRVHHPCFYLSPFACDLRRYPGIDLHLLGGRDASDESYPNRNHGPCVERTGLYSSHPYVFPFSDSTLLDLDRGRWDSCPQ